MRKEKIKCIKDILIGIVKSGFLSFGIYIASIIFFNIVVYKEDYVSERDFTPIYIGMIVFYVVANYMMYIRKQSENQKLSVEPAASFSLKKDFVSYFKSEGKYLLAVYGLLAVVLEVSLLLNIMPVSTVLLFPFPLIGIFVDKLPIPIVRSVAAYVLTMGLLLALTVLEHYRVYKHWNGSKRRK